MKKNQRTIKVYDTSHRLASRLANRFGVSMSALVEIGLMRMSNLQTLELPSRDTRSRRSNVRTALAVHGKKKAKS